MHAFWDAELLSKYSQDNNPILTNEEIKEKIGKDEYITSRSSNKEFELEAGMSWALIDLNADLCDLHLFLSENYGEDQGNSFRFNYQPEFLRWALLVPGHKPDWFLGIKSGGSLIAFISAVPVTIRIYDVVKRAVVINFMCIHKDHRSRSLAPLLIKEISRRVHTFSGITQAIFTASINLPNYICKSRYWHRPLNVKKLMETGFLQFGCSMTIQRANKIYKIYEQKTKLRRMIVDDVSTVYNLLTNYLKQFDLSFEFTKDDMQYMFLNNMVRTYITDTDMASFYVLSSTVLKHPKYTEVKAAYSFYNVAHAISYSDLISDLLFFAKNEGCDVFNTLDIMNNQNLDKFREGNGHSYYYFFNWKCPIINPEKNSIILL
jgi:glycylpeptide N-tetradecanoyltransferase